MGSQSVDARRIKLTSEMTATEKKINTNPLIQFVLRQCGETQTMSHIVNSCPLTKFDGGLLRLHEADEAAVDWLTIYGS